LAATTEVGFWGLTAVEVRTRKITQPSTIQAAAF